MHTPAVYEAMETYVADGDDEVGFRAGDRIEVITKSMDGWWKIRFVCYTDICMTAKIVGPGLKLHEVHAR